MSKLVGCMVVYNEADMIRYSLGSIYNQVDEVLIVEGGVAGRVSTPHSTDGTLDIIHEMDIDNKVRIVQKPNDEYWSNYEENKNEFMKNTDVGDWLIILDADEVYMNGDIIKLRKIMESRPQYWDYIPIFVELYKDFHHILPPGVANITHQRILRKSDPNETYLLHHPTSAINNKDTALDHMYDDRRVVIPDLFIYHMSWMKSTEDMIAKHAYYARAFDKTDDAEAIRRAEEHVAKIGSNLLYYDGPIPEVLHDHPLYGENVVGDIWPHYKSRMEYYYPESIPIVYNRDWSPPPKVSIVITCYKNLDVLRKTLPMWKDVRYTDFEIILVDDGSPVDSGIKEYVESLDSDVLHYRYYYNDSGDVYSIASARNIGIWNSNGSRIIFTDSDMIPDVYFIMEHIVNADSNNITVGSRYRVQNTDPIDYANAIVDPRVDGAFKKIDKGSSLDPWEHCHGANMSMDRKQLIDINGLDEDYDGKWGAEDTDVSFRLIRKGLKVKPVPKSIGYHIDHPSLERQGQRDKLTKKMATDIVRARPKSWV